MNTRATEPSDLNALSGLASELASTFVALASDIAIVIDADGAVRQVVQGAAPLAPDAQAWVGRPWADTVTSDTRRKIEQLLSDVQHTGKGRQREVNHPAGADDAGTIPVSYAAIRLGANGPVLAVGRDLRAIAAIQQRYTESQQEMERDYWKRRQAESRYRMLFQVATDAVLVVDALTMGIVEGNRAAAQLFGIEQDQLAGKHATIGIDRHSWPAVEELLTLVRTTGRAAEIRARLPGGSGAIDISATPFRSESDLLLLVRARTPSPRDVRAAPDAAGTAGTTRWADLVQRIPDAVVITDSSGRVTMANPAFVALCGLGDEHQPDGHELARWMGADTVGGLLAHAKLHGIAAHHSAALRSETRGTLGVSVSVALLDEGDVECVGFTIRRLEGADALASSPTDSLAAAIDGLTGSMGRQSLPELLHAAALLSERHLIKAALQRAQGEPHAAALLLGIAPDALAERLAFLSLAVGAGDGTWPAHFN